MIPHLFKARQQDETAPHVCDVFAYARVRARTHARTHERMRTQAHRCILAHACILGSMPERMRTQAHRCTRACAHMIVHKFRTHLRRLVASTFLFLHKASEPGSGRKPEPRQQTWLFWT